ncbi:MAG: hypothetical protein IKX54_05735 [Lachnospiraceae bacterium]|nr:hypothetical protein [Lachnospiraceae bacterium]
MLKLSKKLRTTETDAPELGTMVRAVRRKRGGEGVFCVMHSEATNGMMEIAPLSYAKFEAGKRDITVFGLAKSKKEALELVRQIVDDLAKKGQWDVSEYL